MGFNYKEAGKAKASFGKKPFFEGGIDVGLMITKAEYKEGHKGKNYIFEFKIEDGKSIATGVPAPLTGSERAYICDMDSQYGYPNLMALTEGLEGGKLPGLTEEQKKELVASGKSLDQITEADDDARGATMKLILDNAVGARVRLTTNAITTAAGKPFTSVAWSHVPGQTFVTIAAEASKLKAAAK